MEIGEPRFGIKTLYIVPAPCFRFGPYEITARLAPVYDSGELLSWGLSTVTVDLFYSGNGATYAGLLLGWFPTAHSQWGTLGVGILGGIRLCFGDGFALYIDGMYKFPLAQLNASGSVVPVLGCSYYF